MEIATLPENITKKKSPVEVEKNTKSLRKNDVSGVLFQGGFRSNNNEAIFGNLITKGEVAQTLNVSVSFVEKLMAEEGLPYFKIGRSVRFRLEEVREWLLNRRFP